MALWDKVTQFLALNPMVEEVATRTTDDEFPDLETQLLRLQGQPRPWRASSVREAMGVPAIFRSVSLIANVTGSLSLEAFRNGVRMTDQTTVPRIITRPNPFTPPRNFFRDTAYYLATRGEAWWWVARRDVDGSAMSLYPVPPWEVVVAQNDKNRLRPTITWQDKVMANEDMRHLTFLPDETGLRGVGPLQLCGAAVSVAVESQEWAADFFAGNLPSVVGSTDMELDENDTKALDAQWNEKAKSNLPRWIGHGITLTDFAFDPAKAQLTESRDFQVGEAVRMLGVPGPLLEYSAPGSSLTYQNNESVWGEFQAGCLSPNYLEPIEQEMSDLLTRSTVARFNLGQLLRSDAKTRWEIYELATKVIGIEAAASLAEQAEGLAPGNVDYAPVPTTPPSAIPSILPPDVQTRALPEPTPLRCSGMATKRIHGIARIVECNKLLSPTGEFRGQCPRCKKEYVAA